jgi:hypothetical protein
MVIKLITYSTGFPSKYIILIITGRRKWTLHLYVVTATNLGLLRANAETSHSVRTGPSGGCGH